MKYKNKWILNYNKGHIRFVNLDKAYKLYLGKSINKLLDDHSVEGVWV